MPQFIPANRLPIGLPIAGRAASGLNFVYRYATQMIKSFRHKGLEVFFETGSRKGIRPDHADKLRRQLARLDSANGPEDMSVPGWRLHPLSNDLAEHFSVRVTNNWRMTFTFDGADAILVDYQSLPTRHYAPSMPYNTKQALNLEHIIS